MAGLAVASKHPAVIPVAAAFAIVTVQPLCVAWRRWPVRQYGSRVLLAGVVALAVFLFLNPAWWSDPFDMPGRVLDMRRNLLDGQVEGYGGYESLADRISGFVTQTFGATPQYYEVPTWSGYIDDQIARYDGSWLAGRGGGWAWGLVIGALVVVGVVALWMYAARCVRAFVLAWGGCSALALLTLTPLEWQRYYLPLQLPLSVIAGAGLALILRKAALPLIGRIMKFPELESESNA